MAFSVQQKQQSDQFTPTGDPNNGESIDVSKQSENIDCNSLLFLGIPPSNEENSHFLKKSSLKCTADSTAPATVDSSNSEDPLTLLLEVFAKMYPDLEINSPENTTTMHSYKASRAAAFYKKRSSNRRKLRSGPYSSLQAIDNQKYQQILSKNLRCLPCNRIFGSTRSALLHEIEAHTGVRYFYRCPRCGYQCPSRAILEHHLRKHETVIQNLTCTLCPALLMDDECLSEHYEEDHLMETPPVCLICGKCFVREDFLMAHAMRHHHK